MVDHISGVSSDIIKAHGLSKSFGETLAVDHIDFSVQRQECFGLLGPNGAGKTTTIRMASCFLEPTHGNLEVLGRDTRSAPRFIKRHIGVCPQENNLDPDLTVEDNLRVYARYFDIVGKAALGRCEELLAFMGLSAKKKSFIDELSGGMKRRLVMARALLNEPEILILDEPTTGLDPQTRHQIWDKVADLKKQGVTIILTTHYMEEAAQLCDRLIIMDYGKILVNASPRKLVVEYKSSNLEEVFLKLTGRDLRD